MAVPLSLYVFCVETVAVALATTRVCRVWKIVACSERDMAYATILVRFVYLCGVQIVAHTSGTWRWHYLFICFVC